MILNKRIVGIISIVLVAALSLGGGTVLVVKMVQGQTTPSLGMDKISTNSDGTIDVPIELLPVVDKAISDQTKAREAFNAAEGQLVQALSIILYKAGIPGDQVTKYYIDPATKKVTKRKEQQPPVPTR